ncbi:MAG: hypothetical protein ACRD26_01890 [Vicinamibacterales bacterium]
MSAVESGHGARLLVTVTGSGGDAAYWRHRLDQTRADVLRSDGAVTAISISEPHRMGNFLGCLNAWKTVRSSVGDCDVGVVNMVVGKGTRLSPFTQRLANRKSAFPTPLLGRTSGLHLTIAEVAVLSVAHVRATLAGSGFRGLLVKWGDEAIIPAATSFGLQDLRTCDAVRFGWRTPPTERLAREKEWLVSHGPDGEMVAEIARQPLRELRRRTAAVGEATPSVNLGMFAISYDFLDAAVGVFEDALHSESTWVDWDPYFWMAFHADSADAWEHEKGAEARTGVRGIRDLESRIPGFFEKVSAVRKALTDMRNRPPKVVAAHLESPFWVDFGSHSTLRECFEALRASAAFGPVVRTLFQITHERDERGNIVVRSSLPAGADIRDSVIIDAVIADERTQMSQGVIFGGSYGRVLMPHGGVAILSDVAHLELASGDAVAFRSAGDLVRLGPGDRHTSLTVAGRAIHLRGNEQIADYTGAAYVEPILGNELSFDEAARLFEGKRQ